MDVSAARVRGYRLGAHHLDDKRPASALLLAAGACGLQNTPPGAFETALWARLAGCTLPLLHEALYRQKSLLQAWSYRGAPVVFPTAESDVFLTALLPQQGEAPWVYTRGIAGALAVLGMPFDDLLAHTKEATHMLDGRTVQSKEALDETLAAMVQTGLPPEKQALWQGPSPYDTAGRQTVGQAAVSFLLRPCAFSSLVVFGERQGMRPTFTSYKNWVGHGPAGLPDAEKQLVRKFLHCYGPTTQNALEAWLGCGKQQARRLWGAVADEMRPVRAAGKDGWMLAEDTERLLHAEDGGDALQLLGPHDPYLDVRDRSLLLADTALQRQVWRTVANPGVVLRGGRIIGTWQAKTAQGALTCAVRLWEPADAAGRRKITDMAEEYAAFRQVRLGSCTVAEA